MGGFSVFPAEAVVGVAVVADRAAALVAGRAADRVNGLVVGVEVWKDEPALPERAKVLGEQTGAENRVPAVALAHEVVEQTRAVR